MGEVVCMEEECTEEVCMEVMEECMEEGCMEECMDKMGVCLETQPLI